MLKQREKWDTTPRSTERIRIDRFFFSKTPVIAYRSETTAKINANKIKKIATAPVPAVSDSPARPNNKPAEDILRFRGHSLLFRVGGEVGIHDGLGDRFDGRVRQHVGVVGSEETLDLVVEDGTGAVVPKSGKGMSGAAGEKGEVGDGSALESPWGAYRVL